MTFVYPYGATLNVAKPAVAVLSTGSVSFPLNRPVCAFHSSRVCLNVVAGFMIIPYLLVSLVTAEQYCTYHEQPAMLL